MKAELIAVGTETNAILYEKLFGNQNGIGLGPVIGTVTETVTETIPNTINQENIE